MPADPPDRIQFAAKEALEEQERRKKEAADREQQRRADAANAAQNGNDNDDRVRRAANPKVRVEDNAEEELKKKEEKEKKEAKDKAEKEQANKENGNRHSRNPGEQPGKSDWWEIGARIATAAGKVTKPTGDTVVKAQELWRNRKEIWKNFKESWTKKPEANSEKNNNNNQNPNGNPNPAAEVDAAGRRLEGAEKQWNEQARNAEAQPAQQGVNPILPAANAAERGGNPVVAPDVQPPVNPANPDAANPNPGRRGGLRR